MRVGGVQRGEQVEAWPDDADGVRKKIIQIKRTMERKERKSG